MAEAPGAPKFRPMAESPVLAKATSKRQEARGKEDRDFAARTAHKKETFSTANNLLDSGQRQMRTDLKIDKREATYVSLLEKRSKKQPISPDDEKFMHEYEEDRKLVESVAAASTLPDNTRDGTQKKVIGLVAYRSHLMTKLSRMNVDPNTSPQEFRDQYNSLDVDIKRINGVASNLDEMVRKDVRIRGRLKDTITIGLSRFGRAVSTQIPGIATDIILRQPINWNRDRFNIPQQPEYTSETAGALAAMRKDEEFKSNPYVRLDVQQYNIQIREKQALLQAAEAINPSSVASIEARAELDRVMAARDVRENGAHNLRDYVNGSLANEREQIYADAKVADEAREAEKTVQQTEADKSAAKPEKPLTTAQRMDKFDELFPGMDSGTRAKIEAELLDKKYKNRAFSADTILQILKQLGLLSSSLVGALGTAATVGSTVAGSGPAAAAPAPAP